MRQYFELKAKHKDALLLFRVGDFYETFGEDAVKASGALGIVLTSRNNGGSNIELAGFPHHSLDLYLPRLVKSGFRVAICEQLEKPSKEKKIVKRGITDVVTPGIGTDDNLLTTNENNFLSAIFIQHAQSIGCSFLDLSTGEFLVYEGDQSSVEKLLSTYGPKEIIYAKGQESAIHELLGNSYYSYSLDDWVFQIDYAHEKLVDLLKVKNLKGYGIHNAKFGQMAAGAIIHYLDATEQKNLNHINKISPIRLDEFVWLDQFTIRNLELVHPTHPSGIPLVKVIDFTSTPMGGRLLRKWLLLPLIDRTSIEDRLDVVTSLFDNQDSSESLDQMLSSLCDIERVTSKIALRKTNPRELHQLKKSLQAIPELQSRFIDDAIEGLSRLMKKLIPLPEVIDTLENAIDPSSPANLAKGGVIAPGYDSELDNLRDLITNSKTHLEKLLQREIESTGITSLKVGFNNVFGYYFEVTNKYKDQGLIPDSWTRKQTLTNSERYISQELKALEEEILSAQDKILNIEARLFDEVVEWLQAHIPSIQHDAVILAQLDCLNSFAKVALRNNYVRPSIHENTDLLIENGRHPVIEQHLPLGEAYIPNNLQIDSDKDQILLITGPNMSGKSAILRQTALICILAQIGSFVPATKAEIGIVDRIFTRVGASDNISSGESTFMVEMIEAATILNNLSSRSLILLDEIGRGTSTYDGISIAWSMVEFLHESPSRPKTLFATHYHELSQLAEKYDRIENFNVATKEYGDKILFIRKLKKGSSNQSFGIQVAKMAGLPVEIIERSNQILASLQEKNVEKRKVEHETLKNLGERNGHGQMEMFPKDSIHAILKKEFDDLNINNMTPIECMIKLTELRKKVKTHS